MPDEKPEEQYPPNWGVDDVIQIDPEHDERFGGCFLLVTEAKSWGVQGFVQIPGGGQAYYRLPWSGGERVGRAVWTTAEEKET